MAFSAAVEAFLEAIDLPSRQADGRLVAELVRRFALGVPTHGAPEGERDPESVLLAFAEEEVGAAGPERVEAFATVATALGLDVGRLAARDPRGGVREVLSVTIDGRRLLVDPAFPLPVALPLDGPSGEEPTGLGRLHVRHDGVHPEVWIDARGADRCLFTVSSGVPSTGAPERQEGALFRLQDDRFLRWRGGVMEMADAWSRLLFPVPATERSTLEAFFPWPLPGWVEDHGVAAGRIGGPELRVYASSPRAVEELEARSGAPWLRDVVKGPESGPRRSLRLEARPGGTRITLSVDLSGPSPFPARGLADPARKTLVFQLVQDLFLLADASSRRARTRAAGRTAALVRTRARPRRRAG